MNSDWVSQNLKEKIKIIFEPRYNRPLTDDEVMDIANSLTAVFETYSKFIWRSKYNENLYSVQG